MKASPPTLDHLNAPQLRLALTSAHKKIDRLEQDNDQLRRALARQNDQIAELHQMVLRLASDLSALKGENEALRAQNEELREQNAALRAENSELRKRLASLSGVSSPKPSPPEWVKANRPKRELKGEEKVKRKKRAHSSSRRRAKPSEVTEIVEHSLANCPKCGTVLSGGWVHRSFQVIGLPKLESLLTEHRVMGHYCPRCRKRVVAPVPELPERIGRHRFSAGVIARVVRLAIDARLPLDLIQAEMRQSLGLALSEGCIAGLLQAAARKGKGTYERMREEIRGSPVVNADETGWREDGQNGYIWSFSTPSLRYFYWDRSRSGEIPLGVLGEEFGGVLVTDFYAAYNRLTGLHQRCWAHLLRDVHELKVKHPEDGELFRWAAGVKGIYEAACKTAKGEGDKGCADVRSADARAREYEEQLLKLCPEGMGKERPEVVLCERIRRYLPELFTFVRNPEVPPTNNAAERSVRPLVIGRKISGGSRSEVGTETRMTLASLVGTAKLNGQDLEASIRQFLTS